MPGSCATCWARDRDYDVVNDRVLEAATCNFISLGSVCTMLKRYQLTGQGAFENILAREQTTDSMLLPGDPLTFDVSMNSLR